MSSPFRWLFFRTKPDVPVIRREVKPKLDEGENEFPSMMFDRQELM
jgi:hypothetical protein